MSPWRRALFHQPPMYLPAWLLAHFTCSSSRLREASTALDDMSLRKIAVAKRLGKVFSMGIRERLFEEEGILDLLSLEKQRRKEWRTAQGCQSEFFFSLSCCCTIDDSYKAMPKLAFCIRFNTLSFIFTFCFFYIFSLNLFF